MPGLVSRAEKAVGLATEQPVVPARTRSPSVSSRSRPISWTATRLCSTFAAFSCGTRNGKRFKAEQRTAVAAREREV